MEYMLLVFSEPSKFDALPAEQQKEGLAAYGAYHEALEKAGVLRSAKRLRPAQAARQLVPGAGARVVAKVVADDEVLFAQRGGNGRVGLRRTRPDIDAKVAQTARRRRP